MLGGRNARMSSRIWIGGLPRYVDKEALADTFGDFGTVIEVTIKLASKDTYAFIDFEESDAGEFAIDEMDQRVVQGNRVKVSWANLKKGATEERRSRFKNRPRYSRSRSRTRVESSSLA